MKTRLLALILLALVLISSACAPASTPAPRQVIETNRRPTQPAAATQAPTAAPYRPAATSAYADPGQHAVYPTAVPPTALPPAAKPGYYAPTATPAQAEYDPNIYPGGNTFQDAGVNPYVDTRRDHLSTFAMDVDTASYTVARRYINQGQLPPEDAVRVEEFVNFFNQDYPSPEKGGFAVYVDGAPSPFHYDGSYLLRVGVQAYRIPDNQRKPANLTFVIDISGSMNMENRLGLVKQSLQLLVDRLRSTDSVGIVVFGTQARVALDPTRGSNRSAILNAIYNLKTEGSTNAEAGLRMGYKMAMQNFRPDAINRVILCSDGVANTGLTNPDSILDTVYGYVKEGVTLTTMGFGMGNFNDALLEKLADKGDGMYAYIDTLDQAHRLFVDELTSTLQVVAYDAKIQVDFNPDVVAAYRLVGYENRAVADQDFRNDAVDAGEVGAGHTVTAIYAVQLRPNTQGRMGTVQVRWADPDTRQVHEVNGNMNTWDLAASFEKTNPRYQLAVVAAQFAEILRRSPWAGKTSFEQLGAYASALADKLPGDGDVNELAGLISKAGKIYW